VAAGPEDVYGHDWWASLVATALGELTFDDFASLEYRRTGSNASPTGSSGVALLRYRLRTFFGKGEFAKVTAQLTKLDRAFGDKLTPEKRGLLEHFLHDGRPQKAATPVRLRQKARDEVALRILFAMGML